MTAFNDDVLFIHIPKCGGKSVREYMRAHLPNVVGPEEEAVPIGHIRLADIPEYTGRSIESFKVIIGLVREPYSRELSQWLYHWMRRARSGTHIHDLVAGYYNTLTEWLNDERGQFHVWYRQHFERPDVPVRQRYADVGGFYRYWLAVDGVLPSNLKILKLEEMQVTLPRLLQRFADHELPQPDRLNTSIAHGETWTWYTPDGVRIVNERYQLAWSEGWYSQWNMNDFTHKFMGRFNG